MSAARSRNGQESRERVLAYIENYIAENNRPPTVREIQDHCGFKSPRAVSYILEKLEEAGLITRQAHSRGIQLAKEMATGPICELPLFSAIPAGMPDTFEGGEADQSLKLVPSALGISNPNKAFAIIVRGESMIDAGIHSGDVVILENKPATNGDIVAALIDGETTLKRLVRQRGKFYLQAENPDYPDLVPLHEMSTQGVVVSVLRRYAKAA